MSALKGPTQVSKGGSSVDPSDPRVRKLVYSMYRDMLRKRNDEANEIIGSKDPSLVRQDVGIEPILEAIIS